MPTTIPTDNTPTIDIGSATVWTSRTLKQPHWNEQPYLELLRLDCHAGPQIDRADFEFRYGTILQRDKTEFEPCERLDLNGQFVKVEILGTNDETVRTWFGVIEAEDNEYLGLTRSGDQGSLVSSGIQRFTAFGLLRLLERVEIRSAEKYRDPEETKAITVARAIPFNISPEGSSGATGNRAVELSNGGVYLFAYAPDQNPLWTAWTAAQYLLSRFAPVDVYGQPIVEWKLYGGEEILDWYIVHEPTEGRSVKELLDALIPRKRGVGYWVDYADDGRVRINLFSINGHEIVLPDNKRIPPNADQRELDIGQAVSIKRARLRNVVTARYDRIIARGESRTSTATLRFNPQYDELGKGWSDTLEATFLDGAAGRADYGALSNLDKYQANSIVRAHDSLETVFRRFQVSPTWNGRSATLFQNNDPREWWVIPVIGDEGEPHAEYPEHDEGATVDLRTMQITPLLALRQGADYTGNRIESGDYLETGAQTPATVQYLRPLIFWNNPDGVGYIPLEQLGSVSAPFENSGRYWSLQASFPGKGPVIDLNVIGGQQQFIATPFWGSAAATDPGHDPEKNGGLDYREFYATLTLSTGVPVEHVAVIRPGETDAMVRTLYIDVPDARLDYVVPYTVVGLGVDPPALQTTSGGFIHDDRTRLRLVAESAAAWYGAVRQTLEVSFRKISAVVELGSLVIALAGDDPLEGVAPEAVNTVVTRISFDYNNPKEAFMEFETSFAEVELI